MSEITILKLNTTNLPVGKWIKDYPTLCSLLNQPIYGGSQKKHQLKEFERFFSYKKNGRKFFITEIYDTPLPLNFENKKSKYTYFIVNLLFTYLNQYPEGSCYISKSHLYKVLGMVNKNYSFFRKDNAKLYKLNSQITKFNINNFFLRCDDKLNKIMRPALELLENMQLLTYQNVYMIAKEVPVTRGTDVVIHEAATEEETRYIIGVYRDTLLELGYEIMDEIHFSNKSEEFYKIANEKFFMERGWLTVYKAYHFIYDLDKLIEAKDTSLKLEEGTKELNQLVLQAIDRQAVTKYKNNTEKKKGINLDSNTFFLPDNYVPVQKMLSQHLIKLKEE